MKILDRINKPKDITKSNIEKYKNRKKIISQIIEEVIKKKYNIIKIIYKNKETDAFKKFKLEASAMLKECGVTVVYSS